MAKLETTLLEDIENSFAKISNKVENYRAKLDSSMSHFETDNHVENLIKSQRLLKKMSAEVDNSLDVLIEEYY